MAKWDALKSVISEAITANGNQEITGLALQQTLLSIVDSIGENATYVGTASPSTTPGTPAGSVCYLASTQGTYVNFGNLTVNKAEIALLKWDGYTWTKTSYTFSDGSITHNLIADGSISMDKLTTALQMVINDKLASANIVQETGDGENVVMSQKAVSEELAKLGSIGGKELLEITKANFAVNLGGDVGSVAPIDSPTGSAAHDLYIKECKEGDIFIVNGYTSINLRLWAFLDDSNVILSMASPQSEVYNMHICAPANTAKIVINGVKNTPYYFASKDSLYAIIYTNDDKLKSSIENVDKKVSENKLEVDNNLFDVHVEIDRLDAKLYGGTEKIILHGDGTTKTVSLQDIGKVAGDTIKFSYNGDENKLEVYSRTEAALNKFLPVTRNEDGYCQVTILPNISYLTAVVFGLNGSFKEGEIISIEGKEVKGIDDRFESLTTDDIKEDGKTQKYINQEIDNKISEAKKNIKELADELDITLEHEETSSISSFDRPNNYISSADGSEVTHNSYCSSDFLQIGELVDNASEIIDFNIVDSLIKASDGSIVSGRAKYIATDFVSYTKGDLITIKNRLRAADAGSNYTPIAFYDDNKQIVYAWSNDATIQAQILDLSNVPDTAKYVRMCHYNNYGTFEVNIIHDIECYDARNIINIVGNLQASGLSKLAAPIAFYDSNKKFCGSYPNTSSITGIVDNTLIPRMSVYARFTNLQGDSYWKIPTIEVIRVVGIEKGLKRELDAIKTNITNIEGVVSNLESNLETQQFVNYCLAANPLVYKSDVKGESNGKLTMAVMRYNGEIIAYRDYNSGAESNKNGYNIVRIMPDGSESVVAGIGQCQCRCIWKDSKGNIFVSPVLAAGNTKLGVWKLGKDETDLRQVLKLYDPDSSDEKVSNSNHADNVWSFTEDDEGNLYCGVYTIKGNSNPSIYKSTDGGETWIKKIDFALAGMVPSVGIHVHCVEWRKWDKCLYAVVGEYNTIFCSKDRGETWEDMQVRLPNAKSTTLTSTSLGLITTSDDAYNCIFCMVLLPSKKVIETANYWANVAFAVRVSDLTGWIYAFTLVDYAVDSGGSNIYYPPIAAMTDQTALEAWKATNPQYLASWEKYHADMLSRYPDDAIRPQHCGIFVSKDGGLHWDILKRIKVESSANKGFQYVGEFINGECLTFSVKDLEDTSDTQGFPLVVREGKCVYSNEGIDISGDALGRLNESKVIPFVDLNT